MVHLYQNSVRSIESIFVELSHQKQCIDVIWGGGFKSVWIFKIRLEVTKLERFENFEHIQRIGINPTKSNKNGAFLSKSCKVNWIDFWRLKAFSRSNWMCWVEIRWNFDDPTWITEVRIFWKIHFRSRQVWIFIFLLQTDWRQKNRICPERTKLRPGASVLAAPLALNCYQIGKQLPTWKGSARSAPKKNRNFGQKC